jgi:hypothetical protein
MAKRAAWIICGGVVYMFSMVALGKHLKRGDYGTDTLLHPPFVRRSHDDWDGR